MRSINLKDLRSNLGKELNDLPIKIIKRGKTIAFIVSELESNSKSIASAIKAKPSKNAVTLAKKIVSLADAPKVCPKHGGTRLGDHYTCGCPVK